MTIVPKHCKPAKNHPGTQQKGERRRQIICGVSGQDKYRNDLLRINCPGSHDIHPNVQRRTKIVSYW